MVTEDWKKAVQAAQEAGTKLYAVGSIHHLHTLTRDWNPEEELLNIVRPEEVYLEGHAPEDTYHKGKATGQCLEYLENPPEFPVVPSIIPIKDSVDQIGCQVVGCDMSEEAMDALERNCGIPDMDVKSLAENMYDCLSEFLYKNIGDSEYMDVKGFISKGYEKIHKFGIVTGDSQYCIQ